MRSLVGTLLNKSPVPLPTTGPRLSVFPTGANESTRSLEAMGQVGTLFSIVNRLSNATSQVEWKLYRKASSGKTEDRTEVTSHAALDLWNRPNPTTTGQLFREGTQQHIDLTGEGWWVIARNKALPIPLELWYVRPDKVSVSVGDSEITGYIYHGPRGEKIPLDVDQVIPLKMPNPMDPWRGMGPVQSILTELDSYRFTAEWNRTFFRNSAEPGGVIEVPETLSDTEFRQMRDRWQEQHQGINNAHRVAVLEGKAKWVDRSMSMRDMQFVQLREVSRDTIREAFGFPKAMMGAADDVNRANAEAGELVFSRWLMVPRLQRFKQALNHQLLPMYEPNPTVEFDYSDPVPPSALDERQELNAKSLALQRFVGSGFDPADVLDALDLPEMRWVGFPEGGPPSTGGGDG